MNQTRTGFFFIFVALLVLIALAIYYVNDNKKQPLITQGVLDLSQTNFDRDGSVVLEGEWEFYWNQLLEPSDFELRKDTGVHYAYVPGTWLRDMEGNIYEGKGYATYRITIENVPDLQYFALKKANIRSASKIFVNGELVLQDGRPATKLDEGRAGNKSEIAYFEVDQSTVELIVQAANHEYIVGGIAKPITFGKHKVVMLQQQQQLLFEFAMILVVLIIGLFYLFLFLTSKGYRRKEPATLPLVLSCLFFSVMNSTYSERVINIFFSDISLKFNFRFGHLISALSVIMVLFVVNKVNATFLMNKYRNGLVCVYAMFTLFIFLFPLDMYLLTLTVSIGFTILVFIVLWLRILNLYFRNRPDADSVMEHRALQVSIFFVIVYWVDLCLYSFGATTNMFLSFVSVCVYSMSLAALLIVRYIHSYQKNEELTIKLIETYSTLDQTNKEVQRNELALLHAQIKPHFLFNALNSIISLCYTNSARAAKLLIDLSNYLKRSFTIDLKSNVVTIANELELIQTFVRIEKARFGDRVNMIYEIDEAVLSLQITPLVIEPLVENAIRHGVLKNKSGGKVKLTIKKKDQMLHVSVEDNGKGMDARQIDDILNERNEKISIQGNGVSLRNIYTRLQNLYQATLNFNTDQNGTTVYFQIPVVVEERHDGE